MKRKLAAAIFCLSVFYSSWINALGLGDVELNSALNEQLEAEIPLVNLKGVSAGLIQVNLATKEDFQLMNLDRPFFLNQLEFKIQKNNRGQRVIEVTTDEAVEEPYLNFLIEVVWPNGRLLREYLVLFDLPEFSGTPSANSGVTGSIPSVNAPTYSSTSSYSGSISLPKGSRLGMESRLEGDSYWVGSMDTLFNVARQVQGSGIDINQAMLAIFDANPDAFINSNINLLKSGTTLQIPDFDQVDVLGQVAASNKVKAYQNGSIKGQNAEVPKATQQVAKAEPATDQKKTSAQIVSDIRDTQQVNDKASLAAATNVTSSASIAEIERLQSELASSLENLDKASLENEALNDRIDSAESKLNDVENLLSLKAQELETLQDQMTGREAELQKELEEVKQSAASPQPAVTAVQNVAPQTVPTTAPAKPSPFSFNTLSAILLGAVALLAGLVAWLFMRSRGDTTEEAYEFVQTASSETGELLPANEAGATAPDYEEPQEFGAVSSDVPEEFGGQALSESTEQHDDTDLVNAVADAIPEDPLSEADVYITYGRNEQAVSMLTQALQKEPENTDYRLKLIEAYAAMGDMKNVDEQCDKVLSIDPLLRPQLEKMFADKEEESVSSEVVEDMGLEVDNLAPEQSVADKAPSADFEEEVATKLDLAKAYFDMGDYDGAKDILDEVMEEGNGEQQSLARELLNKLA